MTAAAPMAMSGWIFWITTGVMKSEWPISASVKRIVATAEAPAPMNTAATTKRGPARKTARSAGRRNGSVQSTRITCSPNTIVVADVENDIVLRMIGSVPHIAAATATKATPGIATSFRRIDSRLTVRDPATLLRRRRSPLFGSRTAG